MTVFPLPSDLTLAGKGALSIDTQCIVLTQGQIQTLIHIYKEDCQWSKLTNTLIFRAKIPLNQFIHQLGLKSTGSLTLFTHIPLPARWTLAGKSSRCVDTGSTILTDLHLTLVHINGTVGSLPLLCAATRVATESVDTEATVLTDAHKLYTLIDIWKHHIDTVSVKNNYIRF